MRFIFVALVAMSVAVSADEPVSVTVHVNAQSPYVGQSVLIEVRIRGDAEKLVQLFSQKLEVPIQLQAAWLTAKAGRTLVLNDGAVEAEQDEGGDYVLRHRMAPDQAGTLTLDALRLRFATARSFREDFIHGTVPVGRVDVEKFIAIPTMEVRALPAAPELPAVALLASSSSQTATATTLASSASVPPSKPRAAIYPPLSTSW